MPVEGDLAGARRQSEVCRRWAIDKYLSNVVSGQGGTIREVVMGVPVYLVKAWAYMRTVGLPREKCRDLRWGEAGEGEVCGVDGGGAVGDLEGAVEALSSVIEVEVDAVAGVGVLGRGEESQELSGGDAGFCGGDDLRGIVDAGGDEDGHIPDHMADFAAAAVLFNEDGDVVDADLLGGIPGDEACLGVNEEVSPESAGELVVSYGDGVLHGAGVVLLGWDEGEDEGVAVGVVGAGVVGPEAVGAGIVNGVVEENRGVIAAQEGVICELRLHIEGGGAGVGHVAYIIYSGEVGESDFVGAGSWEGDGGDVEVFFDAGSQVDAEAGWGGASAATGAVRAGDVPDDLDEGFGGACDAPDF